MLPYLITFLASAFLCWCGECRLKNEHKRSAYILLSFSVLLVALLAGLRDYNIGSDTESYTKWMFDYGKSYFNSFGSYFVFFARSYEPGFVIFSYIIVALFSDAHWLLFFSALVIYGFALMAFFKYRDQCSVSLVWILFLMLTCTEAFNIIRQYMAFSVGVFAFNYAMDKKYKSFFLWTIVAVSFHYGAIVFPMLYLLYLYVRKNDLGIKSISVIAGVILVAIFFPRLTQLVHVDFIARKLEEYSDSTGGFSFQLNPLLIRLPYLLLILFEEKLFIRGDARGRYAGFLQSHEAEFFILMVVLEMIMSQMRGINVTLYRFTNFFALFRFVSYSRIVSVQNRANRTVLKTATWIYVFVIFYYWVVILDSAHVYPYASQLLGI